MRRRIAVLAAVMLPAACELQEISLAEPDDVVVVEVILRAGERLQKALVQRSYGLGVPPAADIRVMDEAGREFRFRPAPYDVCLLPADTLGAAASGCYVWDLLTDGDVVVPGRRYTIRVAMADGRVLTGSTRMPGSFDIGTPSVRACELAPDTTLEMTWSSADDAWVYIAETSLHGLRDALRPRGIDVPTDPLRLVGLSITREDTTIVFPSEFGLFDRFDEDLSDALVALQQGLPPGVTAEIVVGAADRNYVNWVRGGNFNPSGMVRVPSLLGEGGTGVFGSVVTRERTIGTGGTGDRPAC